ncbi:unnamed protein product [Chrysoparadoxa australica]
MSRQRPYDDGSDEYVDEGDPPSDNSDVAGSSRGATAAKKKRSGQAQASTAKSHAKASPRPAKSEVEAQSVVYQAQAVGQAPSYQQQVLQPLQGTGNGTAPPVAYQPHVAHPIMVAIPDHHQQQQQQPSSCDDTVVLGGKRKRRQTSFEGYQLTEESESLNPNPNAALYDSTGTEMPPQIIVAPPTPAPAPVAIPLPMPMPMAQESAPLKKTPGVQHATRKVLEWLQAGPMLLQDITQNLPKLSRAKVLMVLEVLKAGKLIQHVKRHTNTGGELEFYRFQPVSRPEHITAIGSISKDTRARKLEIKQLKQRIAELEVELARKKEDGMVLQQSRQR